MYNNQKDHPRPPRWADKLISWRLDKTAAEEVIGDMHELYIDWANRLGMNRARALYWLNALAFLKPLPYRLSRKRINPTEVEEILVSDGFVKYQPFKKEHDRSLKSLAMIGNYFKIARRNLVKHKIS